MDSKILLGKILQRFSDKKIWQVEGYNSCEYLYETDSSVFVGREKGEDSKVPFNIIIKGIDAYKSKVDLYKEGPTKLREYGITHVTSPVWSLLHLLSPEDYSS